MYILVLLEWFFILGIIEVDIMKRFFFYAFALFILISIIYSIAYDYMTGAEIHYDFYGAFFVCWLIFFGILKRVLRV